MLSPVSNVQPTPYTAVVQGASNVEKDQTTSTKQHDNEEANQLKPSALTQKAYEELSKQDQAKVQQLKKRDLEVKAHEQAHLSTAGSYATSGASFTYTTGPNGVRYATGGEVSINTSEVDGNPAATLRKADAIRRAALAPASPSSQDHQVARNATVMAQQARTELIELAQEEKNAKETGGTKEAQAIAENEESKNSAEDLTENEHPLDSPPSKGSLLNLTI